MYKHIIWDFDGTLFNTYPGVAHTFLKIMKEKYDKDCQYEKVLEWSKFSLDFCAENLSENINVDKDSLIETFHKEYMSKGAPIKEPPFEGAREICELVNERGGINLLVTHRGEMTLKRLLNKYNMQDYFEELISRDDNFPRKPDPTAFLYLIDKYKLNEKDILAVGDREIDVDAAQNAGIKSCYFNPKGSKYEKSNFNIKSLLELKDII